MRLRTVTCPVARSPECKSWRRCGRKALAVRCKGPALPLGTLAANLIGGYLIGVALAVFTALPDLSPQWRLFVITGFLGGLTTFSTFSAEVVIQLQQGRPGWALATTFAHLAGSLALTALGIATVGWLRA